MTDDRGKRSGDARQFPGIPGDFAGDPPNPAKLAADWIAIWQSELAGLAADREAQESWQALLALWAGAAGAMLAASSAMRGHDSLHVGPGGRAGAAEAPRASPVATAPDARAAEVERLAGRVAELEGRLAELERTGRGGGARRGDRRKRG